MRPGEAPPTSWRGTVLQVFGAFSTELCLMSDTSGGFEVDGSDLRGPLGVSGAPENASDQSRLRQGEL